MHDDLRKMIPASNGFAKPEDESSLDNASTNEATNVSKIAQEFEIEYVGMDESSIGTGRVRFNQEQSFLQHIAEFKHVFEHFSTPMADKKSKDDGDNNKEDGKDAFTKATNN